MLFLLFSLNFSLCIIFLMKFRYEPFSLCKIVNIFFLVFFVLSNMLQYENNAIVTSLFVSLTETDYISFQFLVLLLILSYNTIYIIYRKRTNQEPNNDIYIYDYELLNVGFLKIVSIVSLSLTLVYYSSNISLLFFRGIQGVDLIESANEGNALSLIFGKFIRPIPFVCYVLSKIWRCERMDRIKLFILMSIAVFPTGLARNAIAMYWIPVMLLNFQIFYRKYLFVFAIIFAIFVLMPFFELFRYFSGNYSFSVNLDYLVSMNFDASQVFMTIFKNDIVTYGRQLLGVLFFFVPRSIWIDKPIGSGAFVADMQDVFGNISMPFFAEGYINFGYIGVFLFTVILALLTAYGDMSFWSSENQDKPSCARGIYLIMIGALLFILRGDLMSSTAYTVGTIFSFYVVYRLSRRPI